MYIYVTVSKLQQKLVGINVSHSTDTYYKPHKSHNNSILTENLINNPSVLSFSLKSNRFFSSSTILTPTPPLKQSTTQLHRDPSHNRTLIHEPHRCHRTAPLHQISKTPSQTSLSGIDQTSENRARSPTSLSPCPAFILSPPLYHFSLSPHLTITHSYLILYYAPQRCTLTATIIIDPIAGGATTP